MDLSLNVLYITAPVGSGVGLDLSYSSGAERHVHRGRCLRRDARTSTTRALRRADGTRRRGDESALSDANACQARKLSAPLWPQSVRKQIDPTPKPLCNCRGTTEEPAQIFEPLLMCMVFLILTSSRRSDDLLDTCSGWQMEGFVLSAALQGHSSTSRLGSELDKGTSYTHRSWLMDRSSTGSYHLSLRAMVMAGSSSFRHGVKSHCHSDIIGALRAFPICRTRCPWQCARWWTSIHRVPQWFTAWCYATRHWWHGMSEMNVQFSKTGHRVVAE